MKKVYVFALLILGILFFQVFGQQSTKDLSNIIQPYAHINGTTIDSAMVAGVYTYPKTIIQGVSVQFNWIRGISLKHGATDGYICVHLLGDVPTLWTYLWMTNGDYPYGYMIDRIRSSGTTIAIDSLQVWTTLN
jgi:hypothetical protein